MEVVTVGLKGGPVVRGKCGLVSVVSLCEMSGAGVTLPSDFCLGMVYAVLFAWFAVTVLPGWAGVGVGHNV